MINFRGLVISVLTAAALVVPAMARAEQFFILYSDSGIAWRIGQHDREIERRQIELDYAQDVQYAKDDYNAAVNAANQSNDQQEMLLAASQRLQNDLQAAEDRRIARLDALYPNRWEGISNYPDLFIVGYSGPCHFCSFDLEGGSLLWLSFLLPYPGYAKPCIFGWQYGAHHAFGDVRSARATFRSRYEANLRVHPRTPADLAFHNANRFVQTRHRSDQGRTHEDDVQFLSNHHLPPGRSTPPVIIPRASRTSGNTGIPRATGNKDSRSGGGSRGSGSTSTTRNNSSRTTGGKGSSNGGRNSGGRGSSGGSGGRGGSGNDKKNGH